MKISNLLLNYDENFWSIVKDDSKRKDYLNQSYRFRAVCLSLICLLAVAAFVGIAFDKGWFFGLSLILLGAQGANYLNTDSRIMTIRLYELLFTENKNA
jgi:hypothetical protein